MVRRRNGAAEAPTSIAFDIASPTAQTTAKSPTVVDRIEPLRRRREATTRRVTTQERSAPRRLLRHCGRAAPPRRQEDPSCSASNMLNGLKRKLAKAKITS